MRLRKALAVLSVLLLAAPFAQATEITKGPYLQQLTPAGVTVMWEADKPGEAYVELAPGSPQARRIPAEGSQALRRVRIDDLHPGTAYTYRVVDGGAASASYTFTTMPETGAFTFAVYGDSRSEPNDHAEVIASMSAHKPLFVMHTGDVVENGAKADQWGPQFFVPAAPLIATTPFFVAIGNHDKESRDFYAYFGGPTGRPWYSFDCANAHFIILDSYVDFGPGGEQYKWLENDLVSTDKRWRFVVVHNPLYSSGQHGSDIALRTAIEPMLHKYKVDVAFTGHDHIYERSHPIASAFGSIHPITFVVAGGGGAPLYEAHSSFFTAKAASVLNFCVVKIDGDRLDFGACDGTGSKLDSFSIAKSGDGYSDGYPGVVTPVELTEVESSVRSAFGWREYAYPEKSHKEKIECEFAAPSWGAIELSVTWHEPRLGIKVTPSSQDIKIPAGGRAQAKYVLDIDKGSTRAPTASIVVRTSIGEIKFDVAPCEIKQQ